MDYRFKVVLLGDSKVGKTSIVRQLETQTFNNRYNETALYDIVNLRLFIEGQFNVLLQVFDTAGLDRYDSLSGSYFNGASGFVIIFDYQDRSTFEGVRKWIREIKLRAPVQEPSILVLGNKVDGITPRGMGSMAASTGGIGGLQ